MNKPVHYFLWLSLASFLFFTACKKENTPQPREVSQIQLSNLKAGQSSKYLRYLTVCNEGSWEYTGDTLILEVVEYNGGLGFQESLTPNSPLFQNGLFQDPVVYPVTQEEDFILMPERNESALFFFYGNDTIHLQPQHDAILTQEDCWIMIGQEPPLQPFVGEEIGFLADFALGEMKQKNLTVVSCVPMIIDLEAYLFYTADQMHFSHTLGWQPGVANSAGWELLE